MNGCIFARVCVCVYVCVCQRYVNTNLRVNSPRGKVTECHNKQSVRMVTEFEVKKNENFQEQFNWEFTVVSCTSSYKAPLK